MLTDEQQADIAYKLLHGRSSTDIDRAIYEEAIESHPAVAPKMIWFEADLIPSTAPNISTELQLDPITGLTVEYGEEGVVRYYPHLLLTALAGSPNSYFHPCLRNCIPLTYDSNGSYTYKLQNYDGIDLAAGLHDWTVDPIAGVLTFFGDDLDTIGVSPAKPPRISFYQYIGHEGITPIPDSENLLQNNLYPNAKARLVVDATSGVSLYHLPADTGTLLVRDTDLAVPANTLPKFTNANTLGESSIVDDGTTVTIDAELETTSAISAPQITIGTNISDQITLIAPTTPANPINENYTVILPAYNGTLVVRDPLVTTTATRLSKFTADAKLADSHIQDIDTEIVIDVPVTVDANYLRTPALKLRNETTDTTLIPAAAAGETILVLPKQDGTIIEQVAATTANAIPKITVNGVIADSHISDTGSIVNISTSMAVTGSVAAQDLVVGSSTTNIVTISAPVFISSQANTAILLPDTSGTLIAKNTTTTVNRVPKFTSDGVIANSNISDSGTLVTVSSDTSITGYIQTPRIRASSGANIATITAPALAEDISISLPSLAGTLMRTLDHIPGSQVDFVNTGTSLTAITAQDALSDLAHRKLQYAGVISAGPSYPSPAIVGGVYIIAEDITLDGTNYLKSDLAVYEGGTPYSGWTRIPSGLSNAHSVAFNPTGVTYGDGTTPVALTDVQATVKDLYEHKADLDGTGRLPSSQLPLSVVGALQYQGTWNVSVPSQTYPIDTNVGHFYVVVGGPATVEEIYFTNGDWIIRNTSGWDHIQGGNTVDTIQVGATNLQGTVIFAATAPIGVSAGSNTVTYAISPATKLATGAIQVGDALAVNLAGLLSVDATNGLYINNTSKKLEVNLNSNGLEIDGSAKLGIKASSAFTYNLGALHLAATGVVAGTYPKVAVNSQGQITAGYALAVADVPIQVSGETGATEFYNSTNGKVAGLSITGPVNITKVNDLVNLNFTQTNATILSAHFASTYPTDFDWTTRATTTDTIVSMLGAVNANREDLDEYINLLRTQGAAIGVSAGANLIGVAGITGVSPTGGAAGANSVLQAMLEGLKAYTNTVALGSGTLNYLAKYGATALATSSISDTGSIVTSHVATKIDGELSVLSGNNIRLQPSVGAADTILAATHANVSLTLSLPSMTDITSAYLLADFSTIDGGDFG